MFYLKKYIIYQYHETNIVLNAPDACQASEWLLIIPDTRQIPVD